MSTLSPKHIRALLRAAEEISGKRPPSPREALLALLERPRRLCEIAEALGISKHNAAGHLWRAMRDGEAARVARGLYARRTT